MDFWIFVAYNLDFAPKKKAKIFRPPSAAEVFFYVYRIFFNAKFSSPMKNLENPKSYTRWKLKNLFIYFLHQLVEEGKSKNKNSRLGDFYEIA